MEITTNNVYEVYDKLKFFNFDLEESGLNKVDIEKMISFFINKDEFENVLILQRFLQEY
jgi:hypothetical protein